MWHDIPYHIIMLQMPAPALSEFPSMRFEIWHASMTGDRTQPSKILRNAGDFPFWKTAYSFCFVLRIAHDGIFPYYPKRCFSHEFDNLDAEGWRSPSWNFYVLCNMHLNGKLENRGGGTGSETHKILECSIAIDCQAHLTVSLSNCFWSYDLDLGIILKLLIKGFDL